MEGFFLFVTLCVTLSISQPIREVKQCIYPTCLQLTVNVDKVREVFVTDCKINKVTVTGNTDVYIISIKDFKAQKSG